MGNKQSLNSSISTFHQQQWQLLQNPNVHQHPQYGNYKIYRHLQNDHLVDQYQMTFNDQQDYKNYLRSCLWRLRQTQIVNTLYVKQDHKQQFCSTTYCIKVYLQHIQTRLSDITDIPYPQNLYVALSTLDGYRKLHQQLHYFKVQQNQICVDQNGHIRVWINSDLSKNYPSVDQDYHNGDQTLMVYQIMSIITQNTDRDSQPQPQSLKQYFFDRGGDKIGFQDAQIIISQYARKYNAKIPQYFQSILQIYRIKQEGQQQEHQDNQQDDQNNAYHQNFQNHQDNNINRKVILNPNQNVKNIQSIQIIQNNQNSHPSSPTIFKPWQMNTNSGQHHNNNIINNQKMYHQNNHINNYQLNDTVESNKGFNQNKKYINNSHNHKSIPNLHQNYYNAHFNNSNGDRNFTPQRRNFNYHQNLHIQQNQLGFLPTYTPLPTGINFNNNIQKHYLNTNISNNRNNYPFNNRNQNQQQHYTQSMVKYFSPQHSPTQQQFEKNYHPQPFFPSSIQDKEKQSQNKNINQDNNILQRQIKIENNNGQLKRIESTSQHQQLSGAGSNPTIQINGNSHQYQNDQIQVIQKMKNSKNSYNNRLQRSENVLSAATKQNSKNNIYNQGYYQNNYQNQHQQQQYLQRLPHANSYAHQYNQDNTFYYTLDTEEELDPQIAADLKKMFI